MDTVLNQLIVRINCDVVIFVNYFLIYFVIHLIRTHVFVIVSIIKKRIFTFF